MNNLSEEEKEAIEILKDNIGILEGKLTIKYTNYNKVKAYNTILNLINNQQKEIENAKWYAHQMKARINEDIVDFIDDGKEENKGIIGELKETRKQWQDIEKLLNGESKDNLYNDWRKYGEYE